MLPATNNTVETMYVHKGAVALGGKLVLRSFIFHSQPTNATAPPMSHSVHASTAHTSPTPSDLTARGATMLACSALPEKLAELCCHVHRE
jgi:hypothetical protein